MQPCWVNLINKACGQSAKGPPTGRAGYIEAVGAFSPGGLAPLGTEGRALFFARASCRTSEVRLPTLN